MNPTNLVARNLFKATLALAVGALSMSAYSAQWQPVAATESGSLFVDLQSIETTGGEVRARVLRHFAEPRFASDDTYSHVSRVLLVKIDCATGSIESVAANASNKQFSDSHDPLSLARPTSGLDAIKAVACNPGSIAAYIPK
ncbi:MAG: surface-adhesin E family protein [Burkholderiales bacterium]